MLVSHFVPVSDWCSLGCSSTAGGMDGYYISAILIFTIFVVSILSLPSDNGAEDRSFQTILRRLKREIDWRGCVLLSLAWHILPVFAVLSGCKSSFPNPASLSLFSIAVIVVPFFIGIFEGRSAWVEKQSFHHPLWSCRLFQFLLIVGLLTWAIYEFMQFFLAFFSQSAQHMSLVETSIRICQ